MINVRLETGFFSVYVLSNVFFFAACEKSFPPLGGSAGALTPTEIAQAHRYGADFVKLFPANALGPAYLKSICAPLSHVRILAVGGVDGGNVADYMAAGAVGAGVADQTGRYLRSTTQQMLALCRNPKFPSTLVEIGFMTSVEEYEFMLNGSGVRRAAEGIADGVLAYFREQQKWIR